MINVFNLILINNLFLALNIITFKEIHHRNIVFTKVRY